MKTKEEIEQLAMDSLKGKWSHLYQFGYPTRPFPTNYENDLNCVMLGYSLRYSLKKIEDIYEKLEMHILLNEHDWSRNPQAQLKDFINSLNKQD
jgi:hypothetical protein